MSIADSFKKFLEDIAIDNTPKISGRYGEITCVLNKKFRDNDSKLAHRLQVGSFGRHTAIKGISDLDMLYIMPQELWEKYKKSGPASLLSDTAEAIKNRYPKTIIKVNRYVVKVNYTNFVVEIQPVFEQDDGSFKYPDTYSEGDWKITKPKEERQAISKLNTKKNYNLRRLCKMARSWKNTHSVDIGGLLIDTLAYNFLNSNELYDDKSYRCFASMSRDFFLYLKNLPKQEYFIAPGSGQRVKVKENFHRKAADAYELCVEAIKTNNNQNDKWRAIYGTLFPTETALVDRDGHPVRMTEQFAKEVFSAKNIPIDIRYSITLDCIVEQEGFRRMYLRKMLSMHYPLKAHKNLTFYVSNTNIPRSYDLYWKVLNQGQEAINRNCIRGEIIADEGYKKKKEKTDFAGNHIVKCYAVSDGAVVATDRIEVPINTD